MSATILIIDDERELAQVMKARLSKAGYVCGVTTDSTKAFEIIKAKRPDLVITDIMMPKVSGFELCRKIRMDPVVYTTPILVLSAMGQTQEIAYAFEQGASEYLVKPFDLGELFQKVKELLECRRQLHATNPISGLPGKHYLQQVLMNKLFRDEKVAVLHFCLAHGSAYGLAYGHERRDAAIAEVARIIPEVAKAIDALEVYTAHLGGFEFLVLCNAVDARRLADAIAARFEHLKSSLFDKGDLGRGNVVVKGETHPLMHVVIGLITNEDRQFSAPRMIKIARELNKHAQHNGSTKIITAENAIIV